MEEGLQEEVLAGQGGHARVLVSVGDPKLASHLQELLEHRGVRAELAESLEVAQRKIRKNKYRLIFCYQDGCSSNSLLNYSRDLLKSRSFLVGIGSAPCCSEIEDVFLSLPIQERELDACLRTATRILTLEDSVVRQQVEQVQQTEALNQLNHSLTHASKRFEELFHGLPVACFTFDSSGSIHEWNRQAEQSFGMPTHAAFLQPVWNVFQGEFWNPDFVRSVFDGHAIEDCDWTLTLPSGEERHFVCNVFGLRGTSGELVGAISANLDITERKLAEQRIDEQIITINNFARDLQAEKSKLEIVNKRLEQLAITDCMTGLLNHRGFQEELSRALDRHDRLGLPLSLILMDIDHFKQFNDAFGHQAGDGVLEVIGNVLRETTRRHEPAARYGGEEFAILLEGTDEAAAVKAAERFRKAIDKQFWAHRRITASLGLATVHRSEFGREELIRQADVAMYRSKARGRDCATHYQDIAYLEAA